MSGILPTPADIIAFLDEAAIELDDLGKRLEAAHIALGDCEAAWEQEKDIALLRIVEEYETKGQRLPGEDVRAMLARKQVGFQAYSDLIKAKALVKGLEGHVRRLEKAVMARQSALKGLREGMSLEGLGRPPESSDPFYQDAPPGSYQ